MHSLRSRLFALRPAALSVLFPGTDIVALLVCSHACHVRFSCHNPCPPAVSGREKKILPYLHSSFSSIATC